MCLHTCSAVARLTLALAKISCSLTIITTSYDVENSHAYIGDSNGQITVMKVTAEMSHVIDTMKKHTGIYCLNCYQSFYIMYCVSVNPQCHCSFASLC